MAMNRNGNYARLADSLPHQDETDSSWPEPAEALAHRADPLAHTLHVSDVNGTSAVETQPDGPSPVERCHRRSATARADFDDLRFHAAGALGEVFLARNAELNREVA